MSREDSFKKIISGEVKGPVGSIFRMGLSVLSSLYGQGANLKNKKFETEANTYKSLVPVISVGNITAGGTGKTPMVSYIANYFNSIGLTPTILSRGYKAKDNVNSIIVSKLGEVTVSPQVSGDEAWLLAHLVPKSNVVIGRKRGESAEIALQNLHNDVFILDDGFQHREVARDLDIVLIDTTNPFGYGHVLPRGLLREPLSGLQRADFIVLTKTDQVSKEQLEETRLQVRQILPQVPMAESIHEPRSMTLIGEWNDGNITKISDLEDKYRKLNYLAISGIGNPQSFENTLTKSGFCVKKSIGFGDHYDYKADDLITIWKEAFFHGANAIVMTEKDAVKLSILLEHEDLKMPILVLGIGIKFTGGEDNFIYHLDKVSKIR